MSVNNRILQVFKAVAMLFLLSSASLFAQNPNLIYNGDFEITTGNLGIDYTDYTRDYGANQVIETGHFIHDVNSTSHGGGQAGGWPSNLYGYGGSGYYLLFNGFGNSSNPNKVVWRQNVNVTSQTVYTFSCQLRNLSQRFNGLGNTAIIRIKINGIQVGQDITFDINDHAWQSVTRTWNSGSFSGSASIELFDVYTGLPGLGDDFGLDHISFKMHDDYSLSAEEFTVQYCGELTPIDLTDHIDLGYPSGYNPPPMEITIKQSNSAPTWGTECNTYYSHFHATVGSDNRIYLTLNDPSFHGTDYVRYRVSVLGLEPTDKRIIINYFEAPSNCVPQGLPSDDFLCYSSVSSFNPSATWTSNGSAITNSGWQWKKVGETDWQNSNAFLSYVQGQGGRLGEYSIKFFAENECGPVESEPYSFTICDVPQWVVQPNATSVCTGSAEPTVSVNMNYNSGTQTWQYKRGSGNWTDFVWGQFDLLPGDQVRYRVTWDYCGGSPLTSSTINVVSGPEFISNNVPSSWVEEGYCPNAQVTLPTIQSNWYNAFGMNVTTGWYYVIDNPSGSPDYQPINGNSITLNNGSVSVTPGLSNNACGFTPFFPAFDLALWDAPAIQGLENLPDSLGPVCSGTSLSSILPELNPDGHYADYGWEISSGQSQTGFSTNLPTQLSLGDNGKWLRYRVQKDCTNHSDAISNPIRVWVGAAPTLNTNQISLGTVCTGTTVSSLVDVHVTNWNLFHDEDSFERWEVLLNGTWTEFADFEMIHDGCQVRYHAHNECGDAIVDAGVVDVTEGPSFNNPGVSLGFEEYYCDGTTLDLPTPPGYDGHGINVNDFYWAYFDGTEYHRITSAPQLNESWNGYQITYVLESDCGGSMYYPTPHTLVVKGHPEVEISMSGSNTFCVDTPIALAAEIDWHLCTQNTQASSWQYAPVNQPNNYTDFNPDYGIPEAGTYFINYHAVSNECGFDAYGNRIRVTVEAAPEFEHPEQPFELDRFCEDDLLELPLTPSVTGHVENALWRISVGTDPYGTYEPIESNYQLTLEDDGRWLQYYAIGCNTSIHYEVEIHVDGKPMEEYSIAERICKGQLLSYQLINSNDYPITERDWRMGSPTGESFDPDLYTFDVEGEYSIYYRVRNNCGWSDFEGPLHLSVTAGPEFDNSSLPNETQYICEGTTVGEFLQQSGIAEPDLLNPTVPHNSLGWFINGQPVGLDDIIVEEFHDGGLCFGVSGDCSDVPVYSSNILLHVYGQPEVTQLTPFGEFCDGDAAQLPDPIIDEQHGEGHVDGYWEMQLPDGSWGVLPTIWGAEHDGLHVRYHLENTECPDLSTNSLELTITVYAAPTIDDGNLPNEISLCEGSGVDITLVVDWHGQEPGPNGWQVSANGHDWGTEIEGHVFDSTQVEAFFDEMYLRYHAESAQCPNLDDNSEVLTIRLTDTPSINDADWPEQIAYCSGGSLGIEVPAGLPGEWQVSADGTEWSTELEGHGFDPNRIDDYFDGKLLRYFIHSSCGDAVSKVLNLLMKDSEQLGAINGPSNVFVATNIFSGIYRYEIDMAFIEGEITWTLSNPEWQVLDHDGNWCQIYVPTPGSGELIAHFNADCGEMGNGFLIHAGFYGVDDLGTVEVNVYPNPTKGTVTVEAEGIESIRLTNIMGQVLDWREYDRSDSVVLNLNGYTPSVYLLEIKTVDGMVKRRVMLSR